MGDSDYEYDADRVTGGPNMYAYVRGDPVNHENSVRVRGGKPVGFPVNARDPSGKFYSYVNLAWQMALIDPYSFIPYVQYEIEQYAYYPAQALGRKGRK